MTSIQDVVARFKDSRVIQADYSDVEELLCKYFGLDEYSVPCAEETGNDTSLSYHLDGLLTEYDQKFIQDVLSTKDTRSYGTQTLLNYLAFIGLLPRGQFIINVSW